MKKAFLKAEWKNLVMANYAVDASVLAPFLPKFTELDTFENKYYVSLVGFMFEKVKVKGFSIPFHTYFPEVNLRFYVKHSSGSETKRGVVFVSEIVPKSAIAWVANTFYKEKYAAAKMKYSIEAGKENIALSYGWKWKHAWNNIDVNVLNKPAAMQPGSMEEFIFEHYFGYSGASKSITNEYEVSHRSWNVYPVIDYHVNCDFAKVYGKDFAHLNEQEPVSVYVSEGSPVAIGQKRKLF
jgi:hypothetical protein